LVGPAFWNADRLGLIKNKFGMAANLSEIIIWASLLIVQSIHSGSGAKSVFMKIACLQDDRLGDMRRNLFTIINELKMIDIVMIILYNY
jgi:hypothetical protein